MVLQFHPQYPGLGADYIVLIRVVAGRSSVDVNSDLLFSCLFGFVCNGAAADVEEESSKPGRFFKGDAGGHTSHQFLSPPHRLGRRLFGMRYRDSF
jgi:hypothetical protein